MRSAYSLLIIVISLLVFPVSVQAAPDKRYANIQQVTHVSGGWVAFGNGELYRCRFSGSDSKRGPDCVMATGLPTMLQTVSTLWGQGDEAWVTYTDGKLYGCRYLPGAQQGAPQCLPATGLP